MLSRFELSNVPPACHWLEEASQFLSIEPPLCEDELARQRTEL